MVVLSSVILAAGLAGLSKAAPTTRSTTEGTFQPAIGYGSAPAGAGLVFASAEYSKPEIVTLSVEEFNAWAGNATDVTGPSPLTQGSPSAEKRAVIGVDERYYQASSAYPFGAIGRLYMPLGNGVYSWCSGTLVGPRLMASARHCINSGAQYYQFSPGYNNGDKFQTARVTKILSLAADTGAGNCDLKNDWALYVLDTPLGVARGYFQPGDYAVDESAVSGKNVLFNAGYPGDIDGGQRLYMSDSRTTSLQLKSSCANTGPIIGDADVAGGMSGGPLWRLLSDVRYHYGTLLGAFVDGNGNELSSIHAHGKNYIQGINQLNAENPA